MSATAHLFSVKVVKAEGGPRVGVYYNAVVPERIWARIGKMENGCWLWQGCKDIRGYGTARLSGRHVYIHRLIYQSLVGPTDRTLDHLCRVPLCCNPEHLDPVSHIENVRRGNAGKWQRETTHCRQGHPYSGRNLLVVSTTGERQCRACHRASDLRRRGKAAA